MQNNCGKVVIFRDEYAFVHQYAGLFIYRHRTIARALGNQKNNQMLVLSLKHLGKAKGTLLW